jgi:hypothetical protein
MRNDFFKEEKDDNKPVKEVDLEIQNLVNKMRALHMEIINRRIRKFLIEENIELDGAVQEMLAIEINYDFMGKTIMECDGEEFCKIVKENIKKLNEKIYTVE